MDLPESVTAAIVRGMGAYMGSARPTDLPAALRPLRGKHNKMLTARRGDIVGALEDEALRAMVLEWLEDKPSGISKTDAAILTTVTRREDGWEEDLAGQAPPPKSEDRVRKDPGEALAREKERTRRAKDEARRAKDDAARDLSAGRKELASLRAELDELRHEVNALGKALAAAEKESAAARSEMDREVRKARKRSEKAEAAVETEKAKLKELRAELAAVKSRAVAPSKPKAAPKVRPVSEPARRRRLSAPKGRFEDDPETLTEWLSTPHVHLLVDGYNVSKAEGGFGDLTLETQRQRLLQEVGKLARRHEIKATVIFDGSHIAPGTSRRHRGPVEVEYSRADEIADDHLIVKLEGLPKHPVIVATNDRELQGRAARLGATVATSNQLLALIR